MNTIITAVLCVTCIGLVLSVILCAASKLMAVKTDERAAELEECLPGSNCGACGYAGCAGYAKALLEAGAKTNLCTPGGAETAERISELLGVEAEILAPKFAVVRCGGSERTLKMEYKGPLTCAAAKLLHGGEFACAFGCIGYGDCKSVCPFGAVCVDTKDNSPAKINAARCTACGLCVTACPNNLITLEDCSEGGLKKSTVLCSNIEKGAAARKKCQSACIGCGKCVRECPSGALRLEDNLAVLDYEKCTSCSHCAEICVTGCIALL